MTRDPAVWLPELVKTRWQSAITSLRESGVTFPTPPGAPLVRAESEQRGTTTRGPSTVISAYQAADATTSLQSWGGTDRDVRTTWALQVSVNHPGGGAREVYHAASLIIDRLLQLYRKDPETSWHAIENWRESRVEDFPNYQRHVWTLTLARYGEVLPSAVVDA